VENGTWNGEEIGVELGQSAKLRFKRHDVEKIGLQ
jgi:hypothetical protein